MSSSIEICNIALSHIGAYPIQSFTENTKEARTCKLLYGPARDAVLRDHKWNFATKRLDLALLSETYTGWDFAYQYPSDCLAIQELYDPTGAYTGTVYDRETELYVTAGEVPYEVIVNSDLDRKVIVTNMEDAIAIYTAAVTDANLFDTQFRELMSLNLASKMAVPIKGKADLGRALMEEYLLSLGRAQVVDSNEGYRKPNDMSSFLRARQ